MDTMRRLLMNRNAPIVENAYVHAQWEHWFFLVNNEK
jgi:hypothetical protein